MRQREKGMLMMANDLNTNDFEYESIPRKSMGLYVHVPFCVKKCNYCDFSSFEIPETQKHRKYVDGLKLEIRDLGIKYASEHKVDTIFIGGGTPSYIDHELLKDVLEAIRESFYVDKNAEVSMEGNPKTMTKEKLVAYLKMGINRLSLGAQSFDQDLLDCMGRIHSDKDIEYNFKMARECGFQNINLDLMFSIPGQTLDSWLNSLSLAIALKPEHISFYSLQLEEGTPFYQMVKSGKMDLIEEKLDRIMYHRARKILAESGYRVYEISNAALDGFESRHNLKYWNMDNYLGFGLSAHSYIDGVRFSNSGELSDYFNQELINSKINSFGPLTSWNHKNSWEDEIGEWMFTGLRKTEGISLAEFENRFGQSLWDIFSDRLERIEPYIQDQYLVLKNGYLSFTEKGINISNRILAEFV